MCRLLHRILFFCTIVFVLVFGLTTGPALTGPAVATFTEVSSAIGIDITPAGGDRDDWGHGAAFCDYDGDGVLEETSTISPASAMSLATSATRRIFSTRS